jgi:hypothetical protein
VLYHIKTHCEECEGLSDSSNCMPNTNKLFYLKTKFGKKVYLDFTKNLLYLDTMQQTAFYCKGCLKNIFDVTYLRYNPNSKNFTDNFSLIKVGDSNMKIGTVKNLKDGKDDILFIKRIYSTTDSTQRKVRIGIKHNKKFYWFNETQEGDWLWTTDLKHASSFEVIYY